MKNIKKNLSVSFLVGVMMFSQMALYKVSANYTSYYDPAMDAGMNDPAMDAGMIDPAMDAGMNDPAMDAGMIDPAMDAGMNDPFMAAGLDELCNQLAYRIDTFNQLVGLLDIEWTALKNEVADRYAEMGNIISFADTAHATQNNCYNKMKQTYICSGASMKSSQYARDFSTNTAINKMHYDKALIDAELRIPLDAMLTTIINTENSIDDADEAVQNACNPAEDAVAITLAGAQVGMAEASMDMLHGQLGDLQTKFVDRSSRFDFAYNGFKTRITNLLNTANNVMAAHAPNTKATIYAECAGRPNRPRNLNIWVFGEKLRRDAVNGCLNQLGADVGNLI